MAAERSWAAEEHDRNRVAGGGDDGGLADEAGEEWHGEEDRGKNVEGLAGDEGAVEEIDRGDRDELVLALRSCVLILVCSAPMSRTMIVSVCPRCLVESEMSERACSPSSGVRSVVL